MARATPEHGKPTLRNFDSALVGSRNGSEGVWVCNLSASATRESAPRDRPTAASRAPKLAATSSIVPGARAPAPR